MSDAFDPYYKWLGIRPEDQPPHHYRLLALSLFEADADVIASAADQRMSHLRSMQTGKHAALSQQLLNEISTAKICLLNPEKKADYDRKLRAKNAPPPVLQAQPLAPAAAPATAGPSSAGSSATGLPKTKVPAKEAPAAGASAIGQSTPNTPAKKLPTAKALAQPANPVEDGLAVQDAGRSSSSKRTARRSARKRPLPAILAAGGLAALVVGGVAFWLLGQHAAPEPDTTVPNTTAGKLAAKDAPSQSTGDSPVAPAKTADDEPKTGETTPPVSAVDANSQRPSVPKPATQAAPPPAGNLAGMDEDEDGQDEPDESATGDEPQPSPQTPATSQPAASRRETVDLLKLIDPARDSVVGQWKLEAGALVSPPADTWARLQIPFAPPPAYQWTTVVERVAGNDSLSMGMVVGNSQPQVVLDGWGNQKSGVAMVDGRFGDWNETATNVPNVLKGGPHTVVCRVHPDRIEVQVDDRKLIDWRGDSRRLSIDPRTLVPKRDQLYLVTYRTSYRITKMELEPLEPEPAGAPSNPVKPNSPIVSVVPPGPNTPGPNTPSPIPSGRVPLVRGVRPPPAIPRPTRPKRPGATAAKPPIQPPPVIRVAVPSAEQQEKAKRLVLDVFKTELAAAKKGENRVPFARSLLEQAGQSGDDQAARYVLLQMSSELAADGGDLALALEAADQLVAAFDVPAVTVKVDVLTAIAPSKIAAHSRPQAAELALGVADECVAADDYDRASQAVKVATAIAHSSKDANVTKTASRRSKEIAALAVSFAAVQPQLSALRHNPADADANLAVGKWYCLAKEDWDKGLPLLAAGSDSALKAIAAQEQLKPTDAVEMAKLADQWWDLSTQQPDASNKKSLAKRAAHWYAAAEPQLQGLTKTKAQMRLNAGSQKIHKTLQVSAKTCIGHASRTLPADAATGIEVHKGQRVFVHARGKWHVSKKGKPVGAERLVVAIGSADKPALQTISGDQQEFLADASGELFLGIRDTSPDSNSGHMEVEIEIK